MSNVAICEIGHSHVRLLTVHLDFEMRLNGMSLCLFRPNLVDMANCGEGLDLSNEQVALIVCSTQVSLCLQC